MGVLILTPSVRPVTVISPPVPRAKATPSGPTQVITASLSAAKADCAVVRVAEFVTAALWVALRASNAVWAVLIAASRSSVTVPIALIRLITLVTAGSTAGGIAVTTAEILVFCVTVCVILFVVDTTPSTVILVNSKPVAGVTATLITVFALTDAPFSITLLLLEFVT
jgi:hypothetical protein